MRYLKALLRFISFLLLCLGIGAGIFDSVRSVAVAAPLLLPFGMALDWLSPKLQPALMSAIMGLPVALGREALAVAWAQWFFTLPAVTIFLALSLLFWMAGYRRIKPAGRFAA